MAKSEAPAPAGRPKSEEKRIAIRDAATWLFLQGGVTRTSMDSVAREVGVFKQIVYRRVETNASNYPLPAPALGSSNRLRFIRFIARVLSNGDGKGKRMCLQWWAATHGIPAPQ